MTAGAAALNGQAQGRDKPLGFHWTTDPCALLEVLGLPEVRGRKARQTLAAIVADATMEARGQGRAISYARRRAWWAAARRYIGTSYGYDTVIPAVELLAGQGILVDHRIAPSKPGGTGRQSTFRPSPDLKTSALPEIACIPPAELIILKDSDGHLTPYRDTDRTHRMRREMRAINEVIAASTITLKAPGLVRDGSLIRCSGRSGAEHVLYLPLTTLYRVFNNGDWKQGGRLYGGWWQQCPKYLRLFLQIDGEAVVEPDFPRLHPRLLYALAGQRLDGDAYEVPGWTSPEGVAAAKRAFNVLLNAGSYPEALGAIAGNLDGDYRRAAALIEAIRERHAPVAAHFHSGIGLRLQNIDAGMARDILMTLRKDGIVGLPVHDSFIVQARHRDILLEAMEAAEHKAGIAPLSRVRPTAWNVTIPQMEEGKRASSERAGVAVSSSPPLRRSSPPIFVVLVVPGLVAARAAARLAPLDVLSQQVMSPAGARAPAPGCGPAASAPEVVRWIRGFCR